MGLLCECVGGWVRGGIVVVVGGRVGIGMTSMEKLVDERVTKVGDRGRRS